MISPFVSNQEIFDTNSLNLEEYATVQTSTSIDQTSMDERIKELYVQELEKDVTKKLEEKGYKVTSCKVKAEISDKEEETKITKIKVNVQKEQEEKQEQEQNLENEIVTQIQKIKPIDINWQKEENKTEVKDEKISKSDRQNIKKFLIEEYGVNEKCLEIN